MKKTVIVVFAMIIFLAAITLAGQQKRVQMFEQIKWSGDSYGWIERKCTDYCNEMSENVDNYLQAGWQVIGTRPITRIKSPMYNAVYKGSCKCIGTEYILDSGN